MTPSTGWARAPVPPPVERRRRRRGAVARLLTAPLPTAAIESRLQRGARWIARAWPLLALALAGAAVWQIWNARVPVITPRHRAEALCFALAQARFAPPMEVEPGAAVVRGRFSEQTPVAVAIREAMQFTDDMVVREKPYRIGDFDVLTLWLRVPGTRGHLLVLSWMEGVDLEIASFRFAGDETDLTPAEAEWGDRVLAQLLSTRWFHAGEIPIVRLHGTAPSRYGPPSSSK
jgi:hypothetical protein